MKEKERLSGINCVLCALECIGYDEASEEDRKGHPKPTPTRAKYIFKNMSTCEKHFQGYMTNAKAAQSSMIDKSAMKIDMGKVKL